MAPAIPRRPRPEWQPEGEYLFPPPTRPAPAPAARAPISPPPARARRRAAAPIRPPDPRSPDASLTPRRPPRSCGAPRRPLPRARGARRRHSAKQDPPTIPSCARFPPFRWSRAWSPGAGDAKSVLDGRGDQSVHDGQNLQGTVEKRWDRMGRLPQVARQNRRKNWVGLSPLTLGEGPGGTLHPQPLTLGFGLPKPGATFSPPRRAAQFQAVSLSAAGERAHGLHPVSADRVHLHRYGRTGPPLERLLQDIPQPAFERPVAGGTVGIRFIHGRTVGLFRVPLPSSCCTAECTRKKERRVHSALKQTADYRGSLLPH